MSTSITSQDVSQAYDGLEGRLYELMMGELLHIGGLASSLELAERAGIRKDMCGIDLAGATPGVDGCSVPNYAIPLAALARGMARLANPDALASGRAAACRRIAEAMWAEPYMVAGNKRCCTALLEACAGTVVAKTGAEGVYMAGVAGHGLGLAVKARDGAGRASEVAILALLDHLGVLDDAARQTLAPFREPDVLTVNGAVVGGLKAAGWSEWSAF